MRNLDSIIFFRVKKSTHKEYIRRFGKKQLAEACRQAMKTYASQSKKGTNRDRSDSKSA